MDLIIKPTVRCNFSCTFCSSTKLSNRVSDELSLNDIYQFVDKYGSDLRTIIVNGGDPLMMEPEYYLNLLDYIEKANTNTVLAFTTNLWDFYLNPDKWVPVFSHRLVSVTTSFQLDDARRIDKDRILDKSTFISIIELFRQKVPNKPTPHFISVITYDNRHTCLDLVRLAKELGTMCKLNYVTSTGRSSENYFLLGDMYEIYHKIKSEGLAEYEYNTSRQFTSITTCPLNRNCDKGIRCLQPDGSIYTCGSFGDMRQYKLKSIDDDTRLVNMDRSLIMLKSECSTCRLFRYCNGCYHTIHSLKRLGRVEQHCKSMKSKMGLITELEGG
ncbi:TPA: radical SAM protein [Campylobacter jejuni]|nr:radical SAM protein [Campylobacter jejuni]